MEQSHEIRYNWICSVRKNGIQYGLKSVKEVRKYRKSHAGNTGKKLCKKSARTGILASWVPQAQAATYYCCLILIRSQQRAQSQFSEDGGLLFTTTRGLSEFRSWQSGLSTIQSKFEVLTVRHSLSCHAEYVEGHGLMWYLQFLSRVRSFSKCWWVVVCGMFV